ncbi:hypothetical protein [Aureimonas sp. SK2]|uniref:hypothetical protein n=1 Tax=Aureimonas sp. SK2 TaxID=3015992 RepID=UPI002443BEAB|nr:hypothetical protein [Aureimonas sp. SK2]
MNTIQISDRVARTIAALDFGAPEAATSTDAEPMPASVARTLAALDHGAPVAAAPVDAVPPSVRRIAALLGCSVEAAAYIDALETRVARLEEKVSELRFDVRKARRAA